MDKEDAFYMNITQPSITKWMHLHGIMLSEMSDRERQILYYLTDLWNLKTKQMNKHSQRVPGTENQQVAAPGDKDEGKRAIGEQDWEE